MQTERSAYLQEFWQNLKAQKGITEETPRAQINSERNYRKSSHAAGPEQAGSAAGRAGRLCPNRNLSLQTALLTEAPPSEH